MLKTVYNTSANKTLNLEHDGKVYNIESFKRMDVPEEVANKFANEWKEAQITDVSSEAEPWELKVLGSLPLEMQAKVKFKTPERLVMAAEPPVIEPEQPVNRSGVVNMQNPENVHVCPRGCGYSHARLNIVRMHMKKCQPIAASGTEGKD